jgi:basic membrane protein A
MKYFAVTFFLMSFVFLGCTKSNAPASPSSDKSSSQKVKIGIVLDKGGKDDKSFNGAAFAGASLAEKELPIELKVVESADDNAFEPSLRAFAEREYPLVIAIGFAQVDALKKIAPQFPKTHFAIVDGTVDSPNTASLHFDEHEGSYLVGYLAGLVSKSKKIGFIGGMDVPLIRRFQMGYEAGAKAADPKIQIVTNYAGVNSSAWTNPGRGKELAIDQYSQKVDVIFAAAGATGVGVFDAAEEKAGYVIGVDSNQDAIKPGRVLTSMLKRVDTAVYQIIKDQIAQKFSPGSHSFGLKDKGIDYSVDESNQKLIAPYQAKLEAMKAKIMSGEVKVPDYYVVNKGK